MDFIFIDELRVEANVGIYAAREGDFADARDQSHLRRAGRGGRPTTISRNTIDYAEVIARIRHELTAHHFNLLETLGEHIVA